jgi:small-conductance mechanosensitive channel
MKNTDDLLEKAALGVGTWMLIAGVLILGPVGFLLLLAVFYSMTTQNLALGIIVGLIFFSPLILLIIWTPLKWTAVLRERFEWKAKFARRLQPVPEFERE